MAGIAAVGGAVAASALAAGGGWLVFTGLHSGETASTSEPRRGAASRQRASGPARTRPSVGPLASACLLTAFAGGTLGYLIFGAAVPAVVIALFAATFPVAAERRRAQMRADAAVEAWPRMLEEVRLRIGSLGRSIPQALFEAGRSAPPEWQPAFEAAEREWLLTIDFPRTL